MKVNIWAPRSSGAGMPVKRWAAAPSRLDASGIPLDMVAAPVTGS